MLIALHVVEGPDKGEVFQLVEGEPLLLGRSRHCLSPLKDPSVSRVHCEVELEDGEVVVSDHESNSGTFINGKLITEAVLRPGDVLQVGDTRLRLQAPERAAAAAAPRPSEVLRGDRLQELSGRTLSHFHVGPARARGQSGLVFEARDFRDDAVVALKVLFPQSVGSNQDLRRFVRAMKTAMPLRHPNLVAVRGAGKSGPYCWAAMEMVEGESLADLIALPAAAGPDCGLAFRVATHLARGLEYAHAHHIVHRNLTPRNVLVRSADGVVKLGDLMLAKALQGTLAEQLTKPGELLGDVRYMAPERSRGADDLDGRSDLFSLGSLLYTLLTGQAPFEGRTLVEIVGRIRQADPVPPRQLRPGIPASFEALVLRLLAKKPEARPHTAAELLAELDRIGKAHRLRA
jgi:serine/threonine protein kinase